MAMTIEVMVFWVVTPRSDFVRYQHPSSRWRWKQRGPPKHLYSTTSLYGVTTQKVTT